MALQIRRGDSTELLPDSPYPGIKLAEGELVYTRDTQKLYIGDGTTFGGIDLLANISGAVSRVNNKDGVVVLTTDDIAEGTEEADRKYYTAAKAISAVATELIDNNSLHSGIEFSLDSTSLVATVTGEVTFSVQQDVTPKLGGDLVLSTSIATSSASATGGTATIGFATQTTAPFAVGEQIIVAGVTPTDFNGGPYTVLTCTTSQVTFALAGTYGPQTIAGTVRSTHNITGSGNIAITGNFTGTGDIIRTGDIEVTGNITSGSVTTNSINPTGVLTLSAGSASPLVMVKYSSSGSNPAKLELAVSRGTDQLPTDTQAGDYLGSLKASGLYDGEYKFASSVITQWDASADLTKVFPSSSMLFLVGDNTNTQTTINATLSSTGFSVNGFARVGSFATGSEPSPAEEGMIIFDSTTKKFMGYAGSVKGWVALSTD